MPDASPLPTTRAAAKAAGVSRYFTGRPCCRGHLALRLTSNRMCVACTAMHNADAQADPLGRVARREAARQSWARPEIREARLAYKRNMRARKRAEREVAP